MSVINVTSGFVLDVWLIIKALIHREGKNAVSVNGVILNPRSDRMSRKKVQSPEKQRDNICQHK